MDYEKVPDIISCKDLDYLSDMFNWNYGAFKCTQNAIDEVENPELCEHLEEASRLFSDGMDAVLSILEGGNNE